MRKIRMNPDDLRVESFATAEREAEKRGTVRGHSSPDFSCPVTCDYLCPSISGPMICDCQACNESGSCP